ncbi:Hsp20/alpha crystallin family protein [Bacillus massiliglaciei]|uniref:Hsp20/alpha crystallin family protein n=1 Tax=Bacillus massiliglaciei TaxID=1816693 RepID=UPI0018FE85C2|nr:Hsp20/alpha crystallin family protein [Bacillus massiliglaciei]
MSSSDKHNNKSLNHAQHPFSQFMNSMDRLFTDKRPGKGILQSLDHFFGSSATARGFQTELSENEAGYMIVAAIPGVKKEQINIELLPQAVTISIQHQETAEQINQNQGLFHRHHSSGVTSRTIRLARPIDDQKIRASHKDGVLRLFLPKKKGNQIRIEDS